MKQRTPTSELWKLRFLACALLCLHGGKPPLFAGGEEVVVIYNAAMPESEALANYYARRREVPKEQVLGFRLPLDENMTRQVFTENLQEPLARKLESLKLWRVGSGEIPGTNGTRIRVRKKVVTTKIRYAVLCYGVPLRITRDNSLQEPEAVEMRPELRRNEAAVDNELACLPQSYHGYPLTGPLATPLYTVTNATLLSPTNGLLMVTRLDGPSAGVARGLVDKALQAEPEGLWGRAYFDARSITDPGYKMGDEWIRGAAQIARQIGLETELDERPEVWPESLPMNHIALYMGWYTENAYGPFLAPEMEFMPGAFAYHLHSYSAATLRSTNQHWVGPLLAKGATCTMGSVDEPYLGGTPDLGAFAARWMYYGFTFGEAAYASQPLLSWQTTVIGDPLYRPFGKTPKDQHEELLKRNSKNLEWSYLRLVNLSRIRGISLFELASVLEETPTTKESAVLTEKLADLYAAQGKPTSAIAAYERALNLKPSPQQRIRLRLALGEKLLSAERKAEARTNYEKLLEEFPDYAGGAGVRMKINGLAAPASKAAISPP